MKAQQLKNAILQLAIQGKLVPQDPNDEPASELLCKIQAEKDRLIAEGKIKKNKKTADKAPYTIEPPFEIPESWVWVRLGDICLKITDGTHHSPPNIDKGDFLYITAKNIKKDGLDLSKISYVTKEIHNEIFSRCN
ncbi:restriction endonuclease subunit S, partial [Mannheimia haemolytica]|nr:restriction endonuclease subunit S [Mannheimia haemolytica]